MTDYKQLAEQQARLSPCTRRRVGANTAAFLPWLGKCTMTSENAVYALPIASTGHCTKTKLKGCGK